MTRALVTGGSGRLGAAVVDELVAHDVEVVNVDVTRPARHSDAWIDADLTQPGAADEIVARTRPDAIVHLAGIPVPFVQSDGETLRVNTHLAYSLCHAALEHRVSTVVAASSPTVIGYGSPAGWTPEYLPIDEDHPVRPANAYALSKVMVESIVAMFAHLGLRTFAVRPCYVIATEEWDGAPTQAGHTVRERLDDPALGAVSLFNYIDARDAAEVFRLLLERASEVPPGTVLFAGADDALAREPLSDLLPRYHPGTTGFADDLSGDAPAFTSAKAAALLGWKPRYSWRTELT